MKIRMVEQRTGPRWDGRDWPGIGGEIEVGDDEGAGICAAGWAVPVETRKAAETPEDKLKTREETRATPAKSSASTRK